MPLSIPAMPNSLIPKCSVLPYGLPGNMAVWWISGMNDGSPAIVVSLLPARSAEPPQGSGSTGASALRTLPDAVLGAIGPPPGAKLGTPPVAPGGPARDGARPRRPPPAGLG